MDDTSAVLKEKLLAFRNMGPLSPELDAYLKAQNELDWMFSAMRVSGSVLSRDDIAAVLDGEVVTKATIGDYQDLNAFRSAIRWAYDALDMQTDIDLRFITGFNDRLRGEEVPFRKTNPVLHTFGINPIFPSDIRDELVRMTRALSDGTCGETPSEQAAFIVTETIRIYPYAEGSEKLALCLAYYHLLRAGIPPVSLGASEQEFNTAVAEAFASGDRSHLVRIFDRSIYNKLDAVLTLGKDDAEQ